MEPSWADLPHALQALIAAHLSPRTLAVAACSCRQWRQLAAERDWRAAFSQLWPLPSSPGAASAASPPSSSWQGRYAARQAGSRAWQGRPAADQLAGHAAAAKCLAVLPDAGLLFSGGVDRVLRCWDLRSGVQLGASRRHNGTVRCLAADASLLASGAADHLVRVWQRRGAAGGALFDLAGDRAVLAGHAGPVSSLVLTPELLVSGSWDCSLRVWDRASLCCVQLVQAGDWVHCLALRGGVLAAACGAEVLLFRLEGGELRRLASLAFPSLADSAAAAASVTSVDLSADGRTLFAGAADGGVWLADLSAHVGVRGGGGGGGSGGRVEGRQAAAPRPALLQRQAAEVAGLCWDHPWLAVADRSGQVALIDAGSATAAGMAATEGSVARKQRQQAAARRTVRVLHSSGMGGGAAAASAVQCVCLSGMHAAAGLDCGTVLAWDGSKGLQQQAAAAAAKEAKAARRQRNLDRQAAQQGGRKGGGARRGQACAGGGGSAAHVAQQLAPPQVFRQQQAPQEQPQQQHTLDPQQEQQPSSPAAPLPLGRSPSSGSVRVPPPPRSEALAAVAAAAAASGSCRQQAWQVLRPARAASSGGGSANAGTSALGS